MSAPQGPPIARLLPARPLPPYAYLPGHFPHPVRDPGGHSYDADPSPSADKGDPEAFRWGADLFNQGFYWEAHEAWEALWRLHPKGRTERNLLHGLILMAAAGVKLRERKWNAACRHGTRAATYLRLASAGSLKDYREDLGWHPLDLAARIERMVLSSPPGDDLVRFDFALGRGAVLDANRSS